MAGRKTSGAERAEQVPPGTERKGVVLVTGANGFVGRHTLTPLLEAGFAVHAVDRMKFKAPAGVCVHTADLLDADATTRLVCEVRPTHLLHLAWYVEPRWYWSSLENLRWVDASICLLLVFARAGGLRWVGAGTCAEYDWTGDGILDERSTPLRPATVYGASKHAVQTLSAVLARDLGMSAAWCRLFMLYGPHEPASRLFPSLIRPLLAGQRAVCRSGHLRRDFLHVEDAGRALAAVLASGVEDALNVCSGRSVEIAEIARSIAAETGHPELLTFEPASGSEPDKLEGNATLLAATGFRPRYTLEQGIRATVRWWRGRR